MKKISDRKNMTNRSTSNNFYPFSFWVRVDKRFGIGIGIAIIIEAIEVAIDFRHQSLHIASTNAEKTFGVKPANTSQVMLQQT